MFFWRTLRKNGLTCTFVKKFISREGIELDRTRIISPHLSRDNFMRLDWRMRSPFLVNGTFAQLSSESIGAWSWSLISLMFASINKVGLLTDILYLLFFLGPAVLHIISIGRGEIEFLLSLSNLIQIG